MARRGYPAEFRRRVIALVEGGKTVAEVSRKFGISEQTLAERCEGRKTARSMAPGSVQPDNIDAMTDNA